MSGRPREEEEVVIYRPDAGGRDCFQGAQPGSCFLGESGRRRNESIRQRKRSKAVEVESRDRSDQNSEEL